MLSIRVSRIASHAIIHALLLGGGVLMLFPFFWMITTSFKTQVEAATFPPTWFPAVWQFGNYADAWNAAPFGRYFINTIFVGAAVTVLSVATSALAAYAFARIDFFGKNVIFVVFLATMMVPFEVTLIPNFVIVKTLHWYNTYLALIIPWSTSVFGIFLLRQFFLSLPQELYDAALIDGCSRFTFFYRIALPLSAPALITVGLFTFLGSWNSLLWPLIVTGSEDLRVIQVGLSAFQSEASTRYHLQMAAATFTLLPILIIYFFAQKQFIETMASSGIKA